MKFRTRLVLTLSTATAMTLAIAFTSASYVVEKSEERQLDEALRAEAREEAAEIAAASEEKLYISDRGGPRADDVGRLTKYALLFDEQGRVLDRTPTFSGDVPSFAELAHPRNVAFDLRYRGEDLRGILVRIPGRPDHRLFLAASLADLEKDTSFLHRVMLLAAVFSVGCTIFIIWRVVRQLTRGHEAIAEAARRVAAGDLSARVALRRGDDEVVQLARDVDEMVHRLALLVEGQRRFVAHAAHELRSPLTALYGELQLALRRSRSADEYRTAIEASLDAARRLTRLADDLLALARLGADRKPETAPVRLEDVAEGALAWVNHEAERRGVRFAVETDDATVLGNALDLERMLRNLLDNAVRHSPEGGTVRLSAKSEGDTVFVTVADDGEGIAEEDRERVFEPFFRAAEERRRDEGSGLGLAIVREIARFHGGDVAFDPGDGGEGARFRAKLPAAST